MEGLKENLDVVVGGVEGGMYVGKVPMVAASIDVLCGQNPENANFANNAPIKKISTGTHVYFLRLGDSRAQSAPQAKILGDSVHTTVKSTVSQGFLRFLPCLGVSFLSGAGAELPSFTLSRTTNHFGAISVLAARSRMAPLLCPKLVPM